ncbi:unnamed protein product, partial [Mesorhabditis belari]|uniref:Uncharacterized protein n=1 Tax=Mesorhabditis belari TaxID=2138241 RepID=A0AAF3FF67_9BILA
MAGPSRSSSRKPKEPKRASSLDKPAQTIHKPNHRFDASQRNKDNSQRSKSLKETRDRNSKSVSLSHNSKHKEVAAKSKSLRDPRASSLEKNRSFHVLSLAKCTTEVPFESKTGQDVSGKVITAKALMDTNIPLGPQITSLPHLRGLWVSAGRSIARKRLLIVMRSVERMDRVHGEKWMSTEIVNGWSISDRKLLPLVIQKFPFSNNPPITKLGRHQAQLVMRAIMLRGLRPKKIICSPALRCVQTACAMANYAKGIGAKVCIEPGLFEPFGWYRGNGMQILPPSKLSTFVDLGYPIDQDYMPIVRDTYFARNETELEARQRIDLVLRNLGLSYLEGPLLIVGHAVTLHTAFLMGRCQPPEDPDDPNYNELDVTSTDEQWDSISEDEALNTTELGIRYPPGCVVTVAREADGPPAIYQLISGIIPPFTFGQQFSNKPVHPIV